MRRTIPLADGEASQLAWDGAGPALHFAHATGFNAGTYRGLLTPLARSLRVLASDARGHGLSQLPARRGMARGWTIFRDDLIGILERTAPEGAILAGHSMGATVSLMVAAERPELARALVLVEPVLMPREFERLRTEPELARKAERRRDRFPSLDAALEAYRGRGAFKTWADETIADYLKGGTVRDGDLIRLSCAPAWEAECFRSTPFGISETAAKLRCPVTLVHGEIGSTSGASELEAFARLYPKTRVVEQKGASHFLPMEFPQIVREEILNVRNARPGA
jgi:pimeloyl-ACP methyl ester carboxylesterase